jgi:hypothetical protein
MTTESVLGYLNEQAQRIKVCKCKRDEGGCVPISTLLLVDFVLICIFGYVTQNASPNSLFSFHAKEIKLSVEKLLCSHVYSYSMIFQVILSEFLKGK